MCGDEAKASLAGLGEYVAAETFRSLGMSTGRMPKHGTALMPVCAPLRRFRQNIIGSGSFFSCRDPAGAGGNRPPSAALRARVNKYPTVPHLRALHRGKGASASR